MPVTQRRPCMLIRVIHGGSGRNVNHQDSQVIENFEMLRRVYGFEDQLERLDR